MHLVDEHHRAPPCACAACARSTASRMSLTPPSTAEMAMNWASKAPATRRASVVLPTRRPHRIIECSRPDSKATRSGLPGPSRCCWPITSASVCGRKRSASGASAGAAGGGARRVERQFERDMRRLSQPPALKFRSEVTKLRSSPRTCG